MIAGRGELLLAAVACFCILVAARPSCADYYTYTDAKGAVFMTNRLEDVPPKYRAGMKVIREETLANQDREAREQIEPPLRPEALPESRSETGPDVQESPEPASRPEPIARAEISSRFDQLAADYPWFKPLAVIGGLLAAFVIVVKLADLLPSPQLARLIYIAFFLGTLTFAYVTYANQMSSSYLSMKQKFLTLFKKANEREGLKPERGQDPE